MTKASSGTEGLRLLFEDDEDGGCVDAYLDGQYVGNLSWSGVVIVNVEVREDYRRRGIATAMFTHALARGVDLVHSDDLSADGVAWVEHTQLHT